MAVKHVANLSGGACSFWAADRVAEKEGTANLTLLFADVLIEDKQLYEMNERTAEYFGIPITRVSREMTPWQLFRLEGMIGNDRAPICSIRLKREVLEEWQLRNCTKRDSLFGGDPDVIYVGMDWTEVNRLDDLRRAYPHWQIEAPMCEFRKWGGEGALWSKQKMICELESVLGWIPDAYKQGFPHFNCGKRCVRAGITQFVHLYGVDRPAFIEWEEEERLTNEEFNARGIISKDGLPFSVLKDRRGGTTKSMTLHQLRERIEAGDTSLPKDDWGGCGCGVDS